MLGYMQFNPEDHPDISIVSPKPEMLLGHCDLEWHSNGTVHHVVDGTWEHKEWLICLYCVEYCPDTVLSVSNNRDAFLELPEEEKQWWRGVEVQLNNNGGSIMGQYWNPPNKSDAPKTARMEEYIQAPKHEGDERMPVVNIHPVGGKEFLYWQPPLISKAWHDGKEIEIEPLQKKFDAVINRTKYIKDIVFRKGDILIMDQFYTLHRRSPILDKNRELWRVAIDYKHTIDK
jgi:alpha-ketoglutarate-dependent taurine dioxygenase